jgi:hypothetical protein
VGRWLDAKGRGARTLTYIDYVDLATHLAALPLTATNADVLQRLDSFPSARRVAIEVRLLPPGGECIEAFRAIAAVLAAENPRFDVGLWLEWCTDGK